MSDIMAMDRGNHSLKAALISGGRITKRWRDADGSGILTGESVDLLAFCSVVPSWSAAIRSVAAAMGVADVREVTSSSGFPFDLAVEHPETTGTDRLCAASGAWAEGSREAVIVDAGTAVTVDRLSERGFLGGCIFPGSFMLARALAKDTAALPLVEPGEDQGEPPGRSTREAIARGIHWGLIGAVGRLVEMTRGDEGDIPVFLTGGMAQALRPHIPGEVRVRPDLVLEGIFALVAG